MQQSFFKGKYSFDAVYFNNQFHNRIDTNPTFTQYINIDKSMAHGAELTVQARPTARLQVRGAYVYDSTQNLSGATAGSPLLLRPKHSGNALVSYTRPKYRIDPGAVRSSDAARIRISAIFRCR